MGVWGLAPRKSFMATHSSTSENVLLQNRVVVNAYLYAEKEKLVLV